MITVKVQQLLMSNLGFVVLLKGAQDERSLPIFIGAAEAQAIAIEINSVHVPRPLTHDLMKNLLDFLECRLQKIEICDLKEGTFYARLVVDRDGEVLPIDSRPSDAIALALRCGAPILVEERIMDEAGKVFDQSELEAASHAPPAAPDGQSGQPSAKADEAPAGRKLSPLELLHHRLTRAIENERFEDAARLRDEIRRIEGPHAEN